MINVEYLLRKLKYEMTDWLHQKVFCNVNFLKKCLEPELNKKRFSYLLHEYVGFLLRPNFAFNNNELTIALLLFLYEASPCNKVVLQIANLIVNVHSSFAIITHLCVVVTNDIQKLNACTYTLRTDKTLSTFRFLPNIPR